MKFLAIFIDTIREARDKKIFLAFSILTILFSCIYCFGISVESVSENNVKYSFFDNTNQELTTQKFIIQHMEQFLVTSTALMIFLLMIVFTFIMANLLRSGNLDIHLSKPISRITLLLYKFFACSLAAFLIMFVMGSIVWLVLTIKINTIVLQPFIFIALFPVLFIIAFSIILLCVVLKGAGLGISVYLIYTYFLQNILSSRAALKAWINQDWFSSGIDILYKISPKINECISVLSNITTGKEVDLFPLWSSLGFAFVMIVMSCAIFQHKDY